MTGAKTKSSARRRGPAASPSKKKAEEKARGTTGAEACECAVLHEDGIAAARAAAPDPEAVYRAAELYGVFADPTRLRILSALAVGELCVCDLEVLLGASQSAVSHQLAVLRGARLVRSRRDGKSVRYRLDDAHVGAILAVGLEHIAERGGS
jgi:DNA-binding transcriptional ArsR family regulator